MGRNLVGGEELSTEEFSSKNKELDMDAMEKEKINLSFALSFDEAEYVREKLKHIDANKENALLKALGYGEAEQE